MLVLFNSTDHLTTVNNGEDDVLLSPESDRLRTPDIFNYSPSQLMAHEHLEADSERYKNHVTPGKDIRSQQIPIYTTQNNI